ncbi:MAG: magnesium/cobalt transporter CorA [Gammaproteobacteria bacterium]
MMAYDSGTLDEKTLDRDQLRPTLGSNKLTLWIDVQGLADLDLIRHLGEAAGLHQLVISDIVHTHQRPKVEAYDDYVVVVLRMPRDGSVFDGEQLTLVVGGHFLLTFQEYSTDCFELVREQLRSGKGRIRSVGPDYLAYALIDAVIDRFFPLLENYGDRTEEIEAMVVNNPNSALVTEIHMLKHELLDIRHAIWPLREVIGGLLRDDIPVMTDGTRVYLRDCADHAFQLLDMLEVYREIATGLVDLHLSSLSNKMNEAMRFLTMIATIFIPMTFIAGVYGMNFDRASPLNLPELGWRYGYAYALALMFSAAAAMLFFFYRKGWIELKGRSIRRV